MTVKITRARMGGLSFAMLNKMYGTAPGFYLMVGPNLLLAERI
jgi:hypothetical protein